MSKDYEVGYCKPPEHTRFKPRQSGNPKGRPKGSRGLKTDLNAELNAKHTINMPGGKAVTGRRQLLMIRTLTVRAASGDIKAAQVLLPLIRETFGFEDRGVGKERLSASDQALLDELLAGDDGEKEIEPGSVEEVSGEGDLIGDHDDGEADYDGHMEDEGEPS